MRSLADQSDVVIHFYFKVEPSAVKGGQPAFADDPRAEGRGGEMVDIDLRADRGDPLVQQFFDALGTAALFFTGDPGFDFAHKFNSLEIQGRGMIPSP